MEIKDISGIVLFALEGAKTIADVVLAAVNARKSLDGANLYGANLYGANLYGANLSRANLSRANLSRASLYGANLYGASLCGASLSRASLDGASLCGASLDGASLDGASLDGANLYGANLYGASLDGASLDGKKVDSMRVFNGMYRHTVYAVLFQDGQRWIRMGCLWMSLDEWEKIGIRNSNLTEYPDDGSDKCEERVAAFEFAKNTVLRMKLRSTYDRP